MKPIDQGRRPLLLSASLLLAGASVLALSARANAADIAVAVADVVAADASAGAPVEDVVVAATRQSTKLQAGRVRPSAAAGRLSNYESRQYPS